MLCVICCVPVFHCDLCLVLLPMYSQLSQTPCVTWWVTTFLILLGRRRQATCGHYSVHWAWHVFPNFSPNRSLYRFVSDMYILMCFRMPCMWAFWEGGGKEGGRRRTIMAFFHVPSCIMSCMCPCVPVCHVLCSSCLHSSLSHASLACAPVSHNIMASTVSCVLCALIASAHSFMCNLLCISVSSSPT